MPRQPARASGSRGGGSKEGAERHGSFGAFLRLGSGPSVFVLRSSGRKVGRAFRLRANAIRHLDSRADAWPDRRDIGFDDPWTNSEIRWAHWRRWLPNLRRRGWGRHPRRVRRRRGCWCCGCCGCRGCCGRCGCRRRMLRGCDPVGGRHDLDLSLRARTAAHAHACSRAIRASDEVSTVPWMIDP